MKSKRVEVQWYSVRAHGNGEVDNAAEEFEEVFSYDCDKIDLIRQRYSLRRSLEYRAQPQQQTVLASQIVVEFRTFGEIDPAFIQYTDSFHDLEYTKHDNMWLFPAALVEEEEHQGEDSRDGLSAQQQKKQPLSPRPQIDEDILFGRGKRARRPSLLVAVGE